MSLHADRVWANEIDPKSYIDQPGDKPKILIVPDNKMPNTIHVRIHKEDHTLANVLRMKLNAEEDVVFAAYQIPHPTEALVDLKIQTVSADNLNLSAGLGDAIDGPKNALLRATQSALRDVNEFSTAFEAAVK
ncbi:DNA-directed RNA polymerase II [Perkinsela sp. CCAP 1560/4]|nr:DNA-directed RNA polymerase II [Perkinsela sp. CCAP 1560/4]|eukprot:KNH04676.1 DNA-directed RNA polymerase II [Perkinsela sp. CCAP 1560/4]